VKYYRRLSSLRRFEEVKLGCEADWTVYETLEVAFGLRFQDGPFYIFLN
jgi:hypothetical protein